MLTCRLCGMIDGTAYWADLLTVTNDLRSVLSVYNIKSQLMWDYKQSYNETRTHMDCL